MEDMSAAAYYHHHHQPPPPAAHHHYPSYYAPQPLSPGAPPQALPYQPQPQPQHYHAPPPSYSHHQHPYAASYAVPLPPQPPRDDEVRTLFIAGLPDDVKQREIQNLFREFPGFKSAQLRNTGKSAQAYGFAVFIDQQSAVTAMHALNGMVFDLERETTLHIDLAKSNSYTKRPRTEDGIPKSSDKKVRESVAYSRGFQDSGVGSNIHMPGMGKSGYSTNDFPSTQSHSNYAFEAVNGAPYKLQSSSASYVPQNNTPCPTVFVANLGPTCTEQELTQVFSRCPGFLKLKMQNKNGVPVAFVDFQDVTSSTGALNHLQGTVLYSSVGEGMRLEYAKARMGLRRREKKT